MYFKNNINYNNEGKSINIRYFNAPSNFPYIKSNYNVSSNYISNNKMSYLNSTLTKPFDFGSGIYSGICFGLNIHLKNTNSKYLYITIKSINKPFPGMVSDSLCINNASMIKTTCSSNLYKLQLKATNNNISLPEMYIGCASIIKDYNLSVEISLNNNFHNTFYINTMRETAIYGSVGLSNTSQTRDANLNSTIFVENLNNNTFKTIKTNDGYYYFFAQPDTEYTMYYLHNGTLQKFDYLNPSGSITQLNNFTTPSAGNSDNIDIF